MSILIKDVLLDNKKTQIYIEKNKIVEIGKKRKAEHVIDGKGKAAIPGLINTHSHAAMSLLRGYADDMELNRWLQTKIWPLEAKLKPKHLYHGTKLACLEMIRSGTTCFNDMYFFGNGSAIKAAAESNMRMIAGHVLIDLFDPVKREREIKIQEKIVRHVKNLNNTKIQVAINPHAIYSVSKESLQWCKDFADENNLLLHFHLSETKKEAYDCIKKHRVRPVEYLEQMDFLGENLIAAHGIWFDKKEIGILAKNKVNISYNPVSNMKLASGVLKYNELANAKINVCLGTDGCASNNNLDMFETMKFASLLQKSTTGNQTILPASETMKLATVNGAKALRINAGEIKKGKLADIVLIDLKKPELVPHHNLASDIVYSANGSCTDTVICDGKILMRDRVIEGEEKILKDAKKAAEDLINS